MTPLPNPSRMLYSRAGRYPEGEAMLDSNAFLSNLPDGACPDCHGIGSSFDVTESSLILDSTLCMRQKVVAA